MLEDLKSLAQKHPRLFSWAVLAVGMVLILGWATKGVDLEPQQFLSLAISTVLLAGICVWIIYWE